MLAVFHKYFDNSLIRRAYDSYHALWRKDSRLPYLNYIGINFDRKKINSFKIYFHVYSKLTEEEVNKFLPTSSDFFKYYPYKLKSDGGGALHTGVAFTFKFFHHHDTPVVGFHFQLNPTPEVQKWIGPPRKIPWDISASNVVTAINLEYSGNQTTVKRYYYFHEDYYKKYFADRFGFNFLIQAPYIEYAEADQFSKINVWGFPPEQRHLFDTFLPWQRQIIEELCNQYGLKNTVFGFYEHSDIRATYFLPVNSHNLLYPSVPYRDTLGMIYQTILAERCP